MLQSLEFLILEHGFRLANDSYARYLLFHKPFWKDYLSSAEHFDMSRWGDGDDFLVNYIGHPLEGSVSGNIFIQNDPKGRAAKFGKSKDYWQSRFKAMVCHAGVYNWHSMMASDVVRGRERPLGAPPWGDLTQIDKQSPQRFAANFKTPTLVMHGEKDFRVPVTQGFEYYNTLRMKGVPTRLVYFPDENHWVLKPQNSRLWMREFFAWLEKYVGHGPTTE